MSKTLVTFVEEDRFDTFMRITTSNADILIPDKGETIFMHSETDGTTREYKITSKVYNYYEVPMHNNDYADTVIVVFAKEIK